MVDRPFDLLVYGATGYTGKKVAQYAVEKYPNLSIAIAGRTKSKLVALATELGLAESNVLVASLEADDDGVTGTNPELVDIVGKAKIVLACAGPYRQCGMPLVKAAVKAGTDYLDLCGEPQFFDDTLVECEEEARRNNALVVSACAFDCVPAELSAALVAREVKKRYGTSVVSGIEVCHTFDGISKANATTFHAAVDGFHAASKGELKKSRNKVVEKFGIQKAPKRPDEWPKLPQQPGNMPSYHPTSDSYALKFPGADAAAIMASWRYLRMRQPEKYDETSNPRLSVCFGCPDQISSMKVISYGAVFSGLARFKFGCNMLHGNPGLFSNGVFTEGGPSEAELKDASFCTYSIGYGSTSDEIVAATCRGPEPGYVATPRMLVALAVAVLNYRDKLPFSGGVMLPGALFGECEEVYTVLKENDIVFEVLDPTTTKEDDSIV